MNLAQSIFIFLIINTMHGYSKPIKRSSSKTAMDKYDKTVSTLLDETKRLTNSYESNYTLSNIILLTFNEFPIINNSIMKIETLLQYRSTLKDYHWVLDIFRENPGINQLKVFIKNNIIHLDEIIKRLPDAKKRTEKKNEIEKKREEFVKKRSSSSRIETVYSILMQFANCLLDFKKFLFNFARYI